MVGEDFPGVRVPSLVLGDQDGPPAHLAALVPKRDKDFRISDTHL